MCVYVAIWLCTYVCVCVHILMGVFWGCCNKLPQTWWLKTTQIYSLIVLEARGLKFGLKSSYRQGFPGDSVIKNLPANTGGMGLIPGLEDPLEKEMTTQCSVLAWETSWAEEPGGLQSMGSQGVGHNWEIKQQEQSVVRAAVPLDILRENLILPSSIWSLGSSWLWPQHSCLCIWLHMEFLLCVCVCEVSPCSLL